MAGGVVITQESPVGPDTGHKQVHVTVVIIIARGKAHMLRETMKWIEERLDPSRFFRVHRGAIVNIDKIKELQAGWNGDFTIILTDGSKLPLSRRRRRDLEKLLGRAI